jgi:uncharacterized membrane protein YqjE
MAEDIVNAEALAGGPDMRAPAEPTLIESAKSLVRELQSIACDHLQLAALETRQAGMSFVAMVIYGIFAAVLVATAWVALLGGLALWANFHGLPWPTALLAIVVLNLVLAFGFVVAIRRRSSDLLFHASLRQLRAGNPALTEH